MATTGRPGYWSTWTPCRKLSERERSAITCRCSQAICRRLSWMRRTYVNRWQTRREYRFPVRPTVSSRLPRGSYDFPAFKRTCGRHLQRALAIPAFAAHSRESSFVAQQSSITATERKGTHRAPLLVLLRQAISGIRMARNVPARFPLRSFPAPQTLSRPLRIAT